VSDNGDQCEFKKDKTGKAVSTVLKKPDIEAQQRFDRYLEILTKLTVKAEASGHFEEVSDLVDTRDAALKGDKMIFGYH